jgi:two-component system chemotaxis sensor kinase CheA
MIENLVATFIDEANELLLDLEKALLLLEQDRHSKDSIGEVFRTMHSLKGSASMFGFDAISGLTHHLESIYQSIREGNRELTPEVFNTTLACLDHLRTLLEDAQLKKPDTKSRHERLSSDIEKLIDDKRTTNSTTVVQQASTPIATYYILFKPVNEILRNGTNPLFLVDDLLQLGKGIVMPFMELPALKEIVADFSYAGFEIVLSTAVLEKEIRDVFLFVEGDAEIEIRKIGDGNLIEEAKTLDKLKASQSFVNKLGESYIRTQILSLTSSSVQAVSADLKKAKSNSNVRVSSERLDELMNLVSELVTTQASLTLLSESDQTGQLTAIAENVEKITRRLRDNAFTMSLIPIENLLVRFQRLVRDLSGELKKEVEFKVEGADTEIDKSIIEKLSDPLLHLLRNAIDHGIESPEEREKKGKRRQGTILFKSYYSGANVIIEIIDDGAGIKFEKIKKIAVEKGLIAPDADLSEKEIINLIFLPGFSTADQITGVSGRGVGMDVVKRNIGDIRGEIEVTTQVGKGSTFQIRLPLTLSIIDGLRIEIGTTEYILPLFAVQKCYEVVTTQLTETFNQWVTLDSQRIPFLFLREDFGATSSAPYHSQVIKIVQNGNPVGLVVDRIVGDYQAVLKPLGHLYRNQDEFSGATILGDGTVALVIDPVKLIQKHSLSQIAALKRNEN